MKTTIKALTALLLLWAQCALGMGSQGMLGFLGMAREAVWGTAVAATDYAELMSENLVLTIDRFDTRNIYNGLYEPTDYAGARRSAGGIVMAAHPLPMGHILRAAFGNSSASTVLCGFLYTMNHTSIKSHFADGVPVPPYTLEVYRDVTSSHRYAGGLCNRLTLGVAPNGALMATAEWIAQARTLISRTTPTLPASPVDPFTFDTCSVQLAGAATARVEALQMVVDNQLEPILALNNSNVIARVRQSGPQMIRISGTLDYIDVAEEQDFVNQTERAMTFTFTRANSFSMLINVPVLVYTAFPTGQPGRGRNTVAFEGRARYLGSSLSNVLVALTTTKSNY